MTLGPLALSRSTVDRAARRRSEPDLITELLADPFTSVLHLRGDRVPVLDDGNGPRLVLGPGPAKPMADQIAIFLGEDGAGRPHVLLAGPAPSDQVADAPVADQRVDDGDGRVRWASLREVGALLDDTGAGLFTTAVALANWHLTHPRCSRCGQPSAVSSAGWSRTCPACSAEHFPRTDPAVIMAVVDDDDRILLGHQAVWPAKRFSTLAGFVEPGESLEAAVRREVLEESGIEVDEVSYLGSQPWPFPASIMLGFRAHAATTKVNVDGTELADAQWWTREALGIDIATGELILPPKVSIARRLIEHWYGGPVHDAPDAWR